MLLPDYWLPRPDMNLSEAEKKSFDELLAQVVSTQTNPLIKYALNPPKWQFLCHIADHHNIALHGTGDPNIQVFEPRRPVDLAAFGNQSAVFAAGDGLWAMFFAIVERFRYPMSITNACIRVADAEGNVSGPKYVFSVSQTALPENPWRTGYVFLLPAGTFVNQPPMPFGPYEVRVPQLASPVPVVPFGRLEVTPADFPFLNQIRGHDDARLQEYADAMSTGGPWPA